MMLCGFLPNMHHATTYHMPRDLSRDDDLLQRMPSAFQREAPGNFQAAVPLFGHYQFSLQRGAENTGAWFLVVYCSYGLVSPKY